MGDSEARAEATKAECASAFSQWLAAQRGRSYGSGPAQSYGDASWIRGAATLARSLVSAGERRSAKPLPERIAAMVEVMMANPAHKITNQSVAREYFTGVALNRMRRILA